MHSAHKTRGQTAARRWKHLLACVALASAALAAGGCAATTVDVYVPTSATVSSADGTVLSKTTYVLDERGNAVETTVEFASGADGGSGAAETLSSTSSFDVFGVAIPEQGTCEVEVDGQGQPTKIARYDENGGTVFVRTLTYQEVKGRLDTETYESDNLSWTVEYDEGDGWPLHGTIAAGGKEVEVEFVYEVTETGGVTRQLAVVDGLTVAERTFEYDGNQKVSVEHGPDGTSTAYTYKLVEDPSAYAMARALVHEPDFEGLAALLGMLPDGGAATEAQPAA